MANPAPAQAAEPGLVPERPSGSLTALGLLAEFDSLAPSDHQPWLFRATQFLLELEASRESFTLPSSGQPSPDLVLVAPFPETWTVGKPFPKTILSVRHGHNQVLYAHTEGWHFRIRVTDRAGNDVPDAWEFEQSAQERLVVEGQATILPDRLKIKQVSSHSAATQHGVLNCFVLEVTVRTALGELALPAYQHQISVHAAKRKLEAGVLPTSSVGTLRGVGRASTRRLSKVGVETVKDLADVPLPQEDDDLFKRVTEKVCNPRSPFNRKTLVDLIERARGIVREETAVREQSSPVARDTLPLAGFATPLFAGGESEGQ